jgi:hypothetical protein
MQVEAARADEGAGELYKRTRDAVAAREGQLTYWPKLEVFWGWLPQPIRKMVFLFYIRAHSVWCTAKVTQTGARKTVTLWNLLDATFPLRVAFNAVDTYNAGKKRWTYGRSDWTDYRIKASPKRNEPGHKRWYLIKVK